MLACSVWQDQWREVSRRRADEVQYVANPVPVSGGRAEGSDPERLVYSQGSWPVWAAEEGAWQRAREEAGEEAGCECGPRRGDVD